MFRSAQGALSELWLSKLFDVLLRSPACKQTLLPLADPRAEVKELVRGATNLQALLALQFNEPSESEQRGVSKASPVPESGSFIFPRSRHL